MQTIFITKKTKLNVTRVQMWNVYNYNRDNESAIVYFGSNITRMAAKYLWYDLFLRSIKRYLVITRCTWETAYHCKVCNPSIIQDAQVCWRYAGLMLGHRQDGGPTLNQHMAKCSVNVQDVGPNLKLHSVLVSPLFHHVYQLDIPFPVWSTWIIV